MIYVDSAMKQAKKIAFKHLLLLLRQNTAQGSYRKIPTKTMRSDQRRVCNLLIVGKFQKGIDKKTPAVCGCK
ncbi:hypothetical protein CW740_03025 [Kangiella profundi]|uniref:Uncharacterized protein n=1 Tax=Kangiella profundi TaxID=1561924 RepID=A0A2K9AD03_9GAMM|nr:hypothetical protein CW740_03025 [Kangiella profundi]